MQTLEVYDHVMVYRDLLPDVERLYEICRHLESKSHEGFIYQGWRDWYTFGRMCDCSSQAVPLIFDLDNTIQEAEKQNKKDELLLEIELFVSLQTANEKAIKEYVAEKEMVIPERNYIATPNLAYYTPGTDIDGGGHAMNFHTDYNIGEWWWPGQKFLLTCTTYVNDDYEGGEIVFYNKGSLYTFKPRAGDILVFPSGDPKYPGNDPYFHAVNTPLGKGKFLVRSYLKYWNPQNALLWHLLKKQYGEKTWTEMTENFARHKNMLNWEQVSNNSYQENLSDLVRQLYA